MKYFKLLGKIILIATIVYAWEKVIDEKLQFKYLIEVMEIIFKNLHIIIGIILGFYFLYKGQRNEFIEKGCTNKFFICFLI